ncbi:MAG: nucleotide exchange factor GrpE, partial [Mogibacterium sp.]|nr:nucleotide exchange factor GrpE [Mogibacterium sp.]
AEEPTAEEQESERYLRLMAEFQNFKKRAQKEKSDIHAYANEKLIKNLLPVLDNFERALSLDAGSDPEAYAKGMALILEEMKKAMADAGLEELDAEGKDFDPNLHSAVMTEANEELEAGKVSRVFQKGYTLNGRVVRPAMVVVTE